MLSIISKYPDEFRTVRFNATPEDEPEDAEFIYISLMPIEVQRLMESTIDAANSIGIFSTGICKVCKGKAKYAGGYKWKYKKDTDLTQFIEDCREDLLLIHS